MNVDAINKTPVSPPRMREPEEQVVRQRQQHENLAKPQEATAERQERIQPEELLDQIKALTEDGLYSVRFEQERDLNELIVKVVDQETEEVIRQIPPEELIELAKRLRELSGNIVDTLG